MEPAFLFGADELSAAAWFGSDLEIKREAPYRIHWIFTDSVL